MSHFLVGEDRVIQDQDLCFLWFVTYVRLFVLKEKQILALELLNDEDSLFHWS